MSESQKNPSCFSSFFKRLICANDLPTYPDHNQIKKTTSSDVIITEKYTQLEVREQEVEVENAVQMKPGIVARLMGLDSMPENNESLFFRSKSLNSLHFFPDFNSKKASHPSFHRRSATVNSSSSFSFKIEEEKKGLSKLQSYENRGGVKHSMKKKQGRVEKVAEVSLKGNERRKSKGKKKYEEGFATTSTARKVKKNNVGCGRDKKCAVLMQKQGRLGGGLRVNDVGLSKKRVCQNHDVKEDDLISHVDHEVLSDSLSRSPVLSDALSRSPVSVLDHHLVRLHLDYSPSKEYQKPTPWNTRNKPTPKNKPKIYKETPQENFTPKAPQKKDDFDDEVSSRPKADNNHKSKKADYQLEEEMGEYFVGLLGQICRLTTEEVNDPKWVARSQGFRAHFVEELCLDFGGQILDLLLDQLLDELVLVT